jgi:hypothetical protein
VAGVVAVSGGVERRLNPARAGAVVLFIGGMTPVGLAGFARS